MPRYIGLADDDAAGLPDGQLRDHELRMFCKYDSPLAWLEPGILQGHGEGIALDVDLGGGERGVEVVQQRFIALDGKGGRRRRGWS